MTRGKLIAYSVVAMFIGIITFLGVRSVSGPQLYSGDKLETRECRWCGGTGQDSPSNYGEGQPRPSNGVCPGCAGMKKVQVILPGPKHPVTVKGTVRDMGAFKNPQEAEETMLLETAERGKPLQPIKGGVADAKLSFSGPTQLEITSASTGRYRCALEPGDYTLTVTAKDFKEYKQPLHVPAAQAPIWQERAHLHTPEKDADTVYLPVMLSR